MSNVHVFTTLIVIFLNIMVSFFFPQYTVLSENIYVIDGDYSFHFSNEFIDSTNGITEVEESSTLTMALDLFAGAILFIKLIFTMFFGFMAFVYIVPIDFITKLFVFVPYTMVYIFSLVGWIKR